MIHFHFQKREKRVVSTLFFLCFKIILQLFFRKTEQFKSIIAKDRTKTKDSRATLAILPEVKTILLKLKAEQEEAKKFCEELYTDEGYVFTHADGTPYRPDSVTKTFKKVLESHKLTRMRFHDLRHSTASFLFELGWELNDVREWLRHSDIETTANIYAHISKQHLQKMSEKLANTFQVDGETQENSEEKPD